jgi:Putative beta barrel porin-7 (BBP7)
MLVTPFLFEVPENPTDLQLTNLTLGPSSENKYMKIKKLLFAMALAGSCLNQASAQDYRTKTTPLAARHVGDGVRSVGDTNRAVPMAADVRPESFRPKAKLVSNSEMLDMGMLAPTTVGDLGNGCSSGSCDVGACDALTAGCGSRSSDYWLSMDSLLWFGQRRNTPALITTSAQGVLPIAGAAGVTSEFGGADGVTSGLLTGYSLSGGKYIDSCQKIGVGGRVFGIFQNSQSRTIASDGSTSIGIPLFNLGGLPIANAGVGVEDAYLVAFQNGNTPVSSGTVTARADLNMIGAEASTYFLLGRSCDHRIDFVSGYTYNKLKDSVSLTSSVTDLFTGNLVPNGTVFDSNDLFAAENEFHGAHLGVLSSVVHKRITLSTLAKVSFGNMTQNVGIRGSLNQTFNGSQTFPGGIFTQESNIGEYSRNRFAFLPEMRVKMGYALSDCLKINVGYSFMYWSSVALAGNQIDRTIDFSQNLGGGTANRPGFNFVDSGYWMQGVDVGLAWTF